ncbi:MAG: hypothetical protein M5U26_12020 [Planctomycetota bacterium]|nr:hypothetical protein [Planctomycetota bacterium]
MRSAKHKRTSFKNDRKPNPILEFFLQPMRMHPPKVEFSYEEKVLWSILARVLFPWPALSHVRFSLQSLLILAASIGSSFGAMFRVASLEHPWLIVTIPLLYFVVSSQTALFTWFANKRKEDGAGASDLELFCMMLGPVFCWHAIGFLLIPCFERFAG